MTDIDPSALEWRKSRASEETNCVEVAVAGGEVVVRDSRAISDVTLAFSARDWVLFLDRVRESTSRVRPLAIQSRA
jgi:Domain of unknown function (DUF397)